MYFDLTLTESSPGSAQYLGLFSIDSSVLESGKAINLASIGIDLTLAGFAFTTASPASSFVILGDGGLVSIDADFLSDQPAFELHLSDSASAGDPPMLEWRLFEGRDVMRLGTWSFSQVPEPTAALLLAAGLAALGFHRRRHRCRGAGRIR